MRRFCPSSLHHFARSAAQRSNRLRIQPFYSSRKLATTKPFILGDIGEGITEVEIIQWFVKPGDRIKEWEKLCEVQSDKATVDITSKYDGVLEKIHYQSEDRAKVGKALCDIGVPDENEEASLSDPKPTQTGLATSPQQSQKISPTSSLEGQKRQVSTIETEVTGKRLAKPSNDDDNTKASVLATPAVRGLLKEHGLNVTNIRGTGRDGRILKEDVQNHLASQPKQSVQTPNSNFWPESEMSKPLTSVQVQMFKKMTQSLHIPHFLYADEIDVTNLSKLRGRLNRGKSTENKLSMLPFLLKALSLDISEFPLLNARILESDTEDTPRLIFRNKHNIGVAMDTPSGLLVPVIKDIGSRSILDIAAELRRLRSLASVNKLTLDDMSGGTITVSNIGSIGGTYVSPIIASADQVAILGVGKTRRLPTYVEDEDGKERIQAREMCCLSWSADHRVIDGATVARCGERLRELMENVDGMVIEMR